MSFNIQTLTDSRFGILLGQGIGRFFPPKVGYSLTERIARWISSRKDDPMVRAVRANQWVVSRCTFTADQLDKAVLDTFSYQTRSLYNYFRHLYNPTFVNQSLNFSPQLEEIIKNSQNNENAMIIVGIHTGNFDLSAKALMSKGLKMYGISLDNPGKGHKRQHKIRGEYGFHVVQASILALREAERRLKKGGTVLTGMDRPLPTSKYKLVFFDRPAMVPVMHIHLALRTNAPIMVISPRFEEDGTHQLLNSEPIHITPHSNRKIAMIQNAEKVLHVAEEFIRKAPYQWVMFLPVWPEAIDEMP